MKLMFQALVLRRKQGEGEGVLHGHLPSVRLVNLSAKYVCYWLRLLSCLGLLEFSVLTWPPAGEVPVTCLRGGYSPSQRGGQNTPGYWDCLRVNCGHGFANTVRFWGQMAPGRAPRAPAVTFSACLGQLWDNLAIFGFLEAICPWYLTLFARTCPQVFAWVRKLFW